MRSKFETERPRPWQRPIKARCLRCDEPASHFVETITGPDPREAFEASEKLITLVCPAHLDDLLDEYCDRYGSTSSMPRDPVTWRYWLASFWWRPYNRLTRHAA